MIGLYLLTTNQLIKDETIKFGMSMRIEYRWIDYLAIFSDSKYVYYYEFLDKFSRGEILIIEDEILQLHKNERNHNYQTEYFKCTNYNKFHQSIIDVLDKLKIIYTSHDTHNFLDKKKYDNNPESFQLNKKPNKKLNKKSIKNQIVNILTPRADQKIIIDKSYNYFQINEKGMLILMCGVGKTLISLWITQKLDLSKIIIGVPNKLLVKQWSIEIKTIFPTINFLLVKGGITTEDIEEFFKNNKSFIVITTYSSCHKVLSASKKVNLIFDIKINDECHHLTSSNMKLDDTTLTFVEMLNIKSIKQLSLTATLKNLETSNTNLSIVSNDNIKYFGEIIDRKCLLWAITEKIICDYIIQTIITDEKQLEEQFQRFNIKDENNKRLFLSAYATLKSIFDGNLHHLLIYSNNKENSIKLIDYIKILINNNYFDIPNLYFSNYISDMKTKEQTSIIDKFQKAQFGIITCVFCLCEGWDFPKLDGVVIAENMTSNIRIVQSTLRASRKNKEEPNKITKIILPILNRENWLENNDNNDLKKVREVIYQIGLEDETIMTKVKVYKIPINKTGKKPDNNINTIDKFDYYDDELTKILRLKTIPRHAIDITYEKARKIIQEKNIKINSKELYYDLCSIDVRLPLKPDERFIGQFDWIYYLGIERKFYEVDKCKEMIDNYLKQNTEIKKNYLNLSLVCQELCKLDEQFPPNGLWVEYYKVQELNEIIKISSVAKKRGVIL
jgi:predicted helicase